MAQLRKGVLELAILALLDRGPSYGAALVDDLAARPGLAAGAGTVYPLLSRLKRSGMVETTWQESPVGPPRKYYRLTEAGHRNLADSRASWHELTLTMEQLFAEVRNP